MDELRSDDGAETSLNVVSPGMNLETLNEAIAYIADNHNVFLWRKRGEGWGFSKPGHVAPEIWNTIPEAVEGMMTKIVKEIESHRDAQRERLNIEQKKYEDAHAVLNRLRNST